MTTREAVLEYITVNSKVNGKPMTKKQIATALKDRSVGAITMALTNLVNKDKKLRKTVKSGGYVLIG